MIEDKVKIKCEKKVEEATEQVEALVNAYDGFPAQVTVKNCHHCKINIYPSQTKIVDAERRPDERIKTVSV